MQFSDTSTKLGIIQECERNCNLGDGAISGNAALLATFVAFINNAMRHTWHLIFMTFGGWQYDDDNQTDLPAGTINLVSGQTGYALPSTALTVRGIEVLSQDSTTWQKLIPITDDEIRDRSAVGQFFSTAGNPLYYQLVGQTVKLFPAANYNATNGFKVFFDRGSSVFASTDTTKVPGFASEYHDIIPIEASISYLKIKAPSNPTLANLRADYQVRRGELKDFYNKRFKQMFPPRMTVRDPTRENL